MFYTIYKITNKINGKIYIGKHQTKDLDDGYMGSGKHLKHAQNKYGIENFEKEILFQFDNEAEMNAKEAELVNEEFVLREDTYNICVGGQGGFGYINSNGMNHGEWHEQNLESHMRNLSSVANAKKAELMNDETWRQWYSDRLSTSMKDRLLRTDPPFLGKKHSEEWKQNHSFTMKEKSKGSKNSQFGTMWITNGKENKKIKKDVDIIPEGWYKGRN